MKFLGVDPPPPQKMKHSKMVTKAAEGRLIEFLFLAMQWNKTLNEMGLKYFRAYRFIRYQPIMSIESYSLFYDP